MLVNRETPGPEAAEGRMTAIAAWVNRWVPKPFRGVGLWLMLKLAAIARDETPTRINDRVRTPRPISVGNKYQ